jgi:hypothetical protein
MVAGAVDVAESPLALERLLVALDLAVDLRLAGRDRAVLDLVAGEQLGESAVVRVRPGVVGAQAPHADAVRGVEGQRTLDEADDGRCPLVAVEFTVGEPRVVVDDRVHPLVADTDPLLGPRAEAITGDGVAGPREAGEAFAVDLKQLARAGPLVAARLLAFGPRLA